MRRQFPLCVCGLLFLFLLGATRVSSQEAYELSFSTVARGSLLINLPVLVGQDGDVLLDTMDGSGLQCGSIFKMVDGLYNYTTIYDRVPPAGCTDVATYTLSDGKGFSTKAGITITIAANQDPYPGGAYEYVSVNQAAVVNITRISSDPDGDVVRVARVGNPRYGTATVEGSIITYRPIKAKVSSKFGAKDAFTFSVTDGRGGSGQGLIEVFIYENRPPLCSFPRAFEVNRNFSVTIDLQVNNVNESSWPISDPDGDSAITATVDFSTVKFGRVQQLGNGLYTFSAFPAVDDWHKFETFPVTVSDDRGGTTTCDITVKVLLNNAPVVFREQAVSTFSNMPVVVAPLVSVQDTDATFDSQTAELLLGDASLLVVLNFSKPAYGTLEFISCCNSVKGDNGVYFYGGPEKRVADYRYTPSPDLTRDVVENLTYTVADLKGGFVTGHIIITIKSWTSSCFWLIYGVKVPGFWAESDAYYNGRLTQQCGGPFQWRNCFADGALQHAYGACTNADGYETKDVYDYYSPYSPPKPYVCVIPPRRLACRSKSDPSRVGLTMWQSLMTAVCSAECDAVTKSFTAPADAWAERPSNCDVCIDCGDKCRLTNEGIPFIGPEVCCLGVTRGWNGLSANTSSNNNSNTNTNDTAGSSNGTTSRPSCGDCSGQPAAPVCGSDNNTYASACMAACQGVNVTATAPCEDTPGLLDLSQVPDLTSPDALELMRDGFQVLGVARTTNTPPDDDGFAVPAPASNGMVSAAAGAKRRTPKPHHFQVLLVRATSSSSNNVTLLAGLKNSALSKIFNSYRSIAKASQVMLKDRSGKREGWSLLSQMSYPYQAIGMVATTIGKGSPSEPHGFCTGWLIRPSLVVTSAHCVYNAAANATTWPGHLRFLPQVWDGKANDMLQGRAGHAVKALSVPGWYEALSRPSTDPWGSRDHYLWDMAMLYLSEPVACNQCLLRPAIVVGGDYTDRLQMAGYGRPANIDLQLNMSLPFDAVLKPGVAYAFTKASSFEGHSGAPYWPAASPYETDLTMPGAPKGVLPYSWPALGVHQGTTGKNAVMMQFTAAHLKWLFWAGGRTVNYLACSGSDDLGKTFCVKCTTQCVTYKSAGL